MALPEQDLTDRKIKAEIYVERAESGDKLNAEERRHAIAWMMVHRPNMQTANMVELFGVTDRTIREDKALARKQVADEVSTDDIGSIVADIRMTYMRFKDRLEKSTKAANPGTAVYLAHLKAIADYEKVYTEMLQSLGILPKNLGSMTKTVFEFKAFSKRGMVDAVPVIEGEVLDDDSTDLPQLTAEEIEARRKLDAEFDMTHKFRLLATSGEKTSDVKNESTGSTDTAQKPPAGS
jgi:hypothetical protein